MARFIVGIDLGTTHTVVAYAELERKPAGSPQIELLEIEQLIAPGEIAARPLFPSLRYHPGPGELQERDIALPWKNCELRSANCELQLPTCVQGELALELGSRVPGRLVSSAKSWLSHPSVDRAAPILPWGAPEEIPKISPVHASAGYLAYVRACWGHRFPGDPLEEQEIILTVPASFDDGARELTLEAARIAGLSRARLVEEPQAACYDWLVRRSAELKRELEGVSLLLVCDVGGGTTDLTLLKVAPGSGKPQLTRIAVGDHLMLGGDNMDLALAHMAENRIVSPGTKLGAAALSQLVQQCRSAKERFLGSEPPESASVTVLGSGSRLVGGARSAELTRAEVQQALVDGFFPRAAPGEMTGRMRGGIVEFGLPYVSDPAVTRHLAAFLSRHAQSSREALETRAPEQGRLPAPDAVLLNGGVFRSTVLTRRLLDVLGGWRGTPVRQLDNDAPHLAVARGAVAYGLARRGHGLRIKSGSARSYFLMLDTDEESRRGVCVLPRGAEEGQEVRLKNRNFLLRLGRPVLFHLFSSVGDTVFHPGDLAEIEPETHTQLPPIMTVLPERPGTSEIPVQIAAVLTEVGTLEMSCLALDEPGRRWKLRFQLRGGGNTTITDQLHPRYDEAVARILKIFGPRSREIFARDVKGLRRELEAILGARETWDPPLLREMFGRLWDGVRHRRRSGDHERVWFNLAGYCLRPGYGYPLDDWRMKLLWSIHDQGVQYRETPVYSEWWTLWRRVAGGLDAEAQQQLFHEISSELRPQPAVLKRAAAAKRQGSEDTVRLAGALERLPPELKIQLGEWLLERLKKSGESAETWVAVGRIGARVPFYGSSHNAVSKETAEEWIKRVLSHDWKDKSQPAFAATLLARMSGDRQRDLDEELRSRVAARLRGFNAPPSWLGMVEGIVEMDEADEQRVFGESLPSGLRLLR